MSREEPPRSSCGSNILQRRSSCAFIMQPQRSSCGFQDSSSSDPQSAARRTSSCERKKKVSCIIFGLYCIHERGGADGHCRYPARSFIFNSDAQTKQMRVKSINTCTCKTAHDNPYCKQPLIQKRYLQCTRDKREISRETVLVSGKTSLVSRDTSVVSRETVVTYI